MTAHLCVEYFTIFHPPIVPTASPVLLALGWGIIATWWVGLALGIGLAAAARIGRVPTLGPRELRRPVIELMLISAASAIAAGAIGATLTATGAIWVAEPRAAHIPPSKHIAFHADRWAHSVSYLVGGLGGILLIVRTALKRRRR